MMDEKNTSAQTRKLLLEHCLAYPKLRIQDLFKFIFQSSFGCEHMVSSAEDAAEYICKEHEAYCGVTGFTNLVVPLDGAYSRVSLSIIDRGLSPETFGRIFAASAVTEEDGKTALMQKIDVLKNMINDRTLAFDPDEFDEALSAWEADGFQAVHHSEQFRLNYHPSYRVISNTYIPYLGMFAEIDRLLETHAENAMLPEYCDEGGKLHGDSNPSGRVIVAIEGGSASGKTTLAGILEKIYDCTVFHMDDFFLQPSQRMEERLAEIGGNVDRERFLEEVLVPVHEGRTVNYRKFNCSTMTIEDGEAFTPNRLVIVEGAYSMHPELESYYDLAVFLDITEDEQKRRILHRNSSEMAKRFFNEWIPLEKRYFDGTDVKSRCDMVIGNCTER